MLSGMSAENGAYEAAEEKEEGEETKSGTPSADCRVGPRVDDDLVVENSPLGRFHRYFAPGG